MKRNVRRHAVEQPLDPSYRLIPLTKGLATKVSTGRYQELSRYNWCASKERDGFIAVRRENGKMLILHAEICPCPVGTVPDHVNGDRLDNRDENLRPSTNSQNGANRPAQRNNTSGYKGVVFDKPRGLWRAQIKVQQKMKFVGRFGTAASAARAYDAAAILHFGEFARLNFPHDPPDPSATCSKISSQTAS